MKFKVLMSGFISLLLSGCFLASQEIPLNSIADFDVIVKLKSHDSQITMTGLLTNSSMGISDMKTSIDGDTLNIILYQKMAGKKYSGRLDKEFIVKHNIRKITYGSNRKLIWEAK